MGDTVNLALPSGTLWAACNVGANRPEEYGAYFAWGETVPKSAYTAENYTYTGGGRLPLSDDAANKYMGSQWHMPTKEQIEELFANTSSAWTAVSYVLNNGTEITVTGATLTSNMNGEAIFFPAAGHRLASSSFDVGKAFRVWSSEMFYISNSANEHTELSDRAWYFFGKNERGFRDNSGGNGRRCFGYSVRGVIG